MGLVKGNVAVVAHTVSMAWLASLTPRVSAANVALTQSDPPPSDEETAVRLTAQCGCGIGLQASATVFAIKMSAKDTAWDAEFEHEKCSKIGERPFQIPFYRKIRKKRGRKRR